MIRSFHKSRQLTRLVRKPTQSFSIFDSLKDQVFRMAGLSKEVELPPLFLENPNNLEMYYQDIREILDRFAELGQMETKLLNCETAEEKLGQLKVLINFANKNQFYEEAIVYNRYRRNIVMQLNMHWILLSTFGLILFTGNWLENSYTSDAESDSDMLSLEDHLREVMHKLGLPTWSAKPKKKSKEATVTFKDVLVR